MHTLGRLAVKCNRFSLRLSASQLQRVLATQATQATSRLTYPVRPPPGMQNGRLVDTAMWSKIQTIFPINYWDQPASVLHDEEHEVRLHVGNARQLAERPTLATTGFELVEQRGADFDFESEQGRAAYLEATTDLVLRMTGASFATVFHSMTRRSDRDNKDSTKGAGGLDSRHHAAVLRVHADFTPENGPQRVSDLEARGLVPPGTLQKRWSIVNVWRSMSEHPILERPLALLDARTVDQRSLWSYALVHEPSAEVGVNNSVAFSEEHRWYYYPEQTLDEALVFYTFNGTTAGSPTFVFHTAFDPPPPDGMSGSLPPRQSIEARFLAVFDD